MNNNRQITNFSNVVTSASKETREVYIGNRETIEVEYYVLPASTLTGGPSINRIGYVCEPRGIDYPIVFITDEQEQTIYLGKTGIYETMPETFIDINDPESKEMECISEFTTIKLPCGKAGDVPIKFKLDYAFSTN